jgi:hypothetical protein
MRRGLIAALLLPLLPSVAQADNPGPTFKSVVVGTPSGGNMGSGTLNAEGLYVNGVAVGGGASTNFVYGISWGSSETAPTAAGTGYAAGDTVTLTAATCSTPPVIVVSTLSGSAVATWALQNPGICTASPAGALAQASTSGAGTGVTITPNWSIYSLADRFPGVAVGNSHTPASNNVFVDGAVNVTTSGYYNTAVGPGALAANVAGMESTAIGWNALQTYTGTGPAGNVAIGVASMRLLTTGINNVAVGTDTMNSVLTASSDTAVGIGALRQDNGGNNTALGYSAMTNGTATTAQNVAIGSQAMQGQSSVSGVTQSVAIGTLAMSGAATLTSAARDVFIGFNSGLVVTSGTDNTAVGSNTMQTMAAGNQSTAIGSSSMISATGGTDTCVGYNTCPSVTGTGNTAIGANSMVSTSSANNSTAAGSGAMRFVSTGASSTGLGAQALGGISGGSPMTGSSNVAVGFQTAVNLTSAASWTAVGTQAGQGAAGVPSTGAGNSLFGYKAGNLLQGAANNNLILGQQVASLTLTTGNNIIAIGTSSSCDASAAAATNEIHLCGSGGDVLLVTGTNAATTAKAMFAGAIQVGSTTALTIVGGEVGLAKITASGSAPGAAGGKFELVCGTNAGSAKLIAYAGTSTTPVTITDNIGSGVTGC